MEYRRFEPATASSLGFSYNAPSVLSQVQSFVADFKNGQNPAQVQAAALQADVVAHSMGGDIARALAQQPGFLSSNSLGQGNIHKVITIGTPHLGSPLAIQLLSDNNMCVRSMLALVGNFSFDKVNVFAQDTTGGVSDLQGDGVGGALSSALLNLQSPVSRPLPTAFISGTAGPAQLAGLVGTFAQVISAFCAGDPLADRLNPTGWPTLFYDPQKNPLSLSDAIVSLPSQLNGQAGTPFSGVVHSRGAELLGFNGPAEQDDSTGIPAAVIDLLNTPLTKPVYTPLP
jgi:hypothetical protein